MIRCEREEEVVAFAYQQPQTEFLLLVVQRIAHLQPFNEHFRSGIAQIAGQRPVGISKLSKTRNVVVPKDEIILIGTH